MIANKNFDQRVSFAYRIYTDQSSKYRKVYPYSEYNQRNTFKSRLCTACIPVIVTI